MVVKKTKAAVAVEQVLDVSQSVLGTWRRCHMKYNYRYVQLLERKKPVVYFVVGKIIGECLDALAERRMNPKAKTWQSILEEHQKQYGKLFRAEQEYYGDPIGTAHRIISRYEALYKDDGLKYTTLDMESKRPFELSGKIELAPGIVFTFHIDKMPVDKHGRYWIMDHKAYKNIPDADSRFSALQLVFYYKVAPMAGYPKPSGLIWDYLRKKPPTVPEQLKNGELSQRQNIDTDYDTYLAEVKRLKLDPKDYQKILKPLKDRGQLDFYQRVTMAAPTPTLVEQIWDDARTTAIEIQQMGRTNKTRSMQRDCKQCEYYNLCQAELRGLDASFIKKTEYQKVKEVRHDHSFMVEDD